MSQPTHVSVLLGGSDTDRPPLVLLHGSEGTEVDLLALADRVAPGSPRLGIRGTLALEAGYAFFRRQADRRVDETDLAIRATSLAVFIEGFSERGQFRTPPIAIGYSNGAIMAAGLVLSRPGVLAGAVLFRPSSPFPAAPGHRLDATPVLIIDGAEDPRRSPGAGARLARQLQEVGARVSHEVLPVGHGLTPEDEEITRHWLSRPAGCSHPGD